MVSHLLAAGDRHLVHGEVAHLHEADGTPCTTKQGERANSGAPPALVAFGDYDAMRLRQFASEHGGALVEGWKVYAAASLFSEAAE